MLISLLLMDNFPIFFCFQTRKTNFCSLIFSVFQDEKAQLHTYRSSMLRLNASVHSWLTRHEKRKQSNESTASTSDKINRSAVNTQHDESSNAHDATAVNSTADSSTSLDLTVITVKSVNDIATETDDWTVDEELHKQLKNDVGNMYKVWDDADKR